MSSSGYIPTNAYEGSGARSYDFQETYEGFDEMEEEDAFNSETFDVGDVGKDFDFGSTAKSSAMSTLNVVPNVSYARVAANDDDFMKDLWGVSTGGGEVKESQKDPSNKKFLSLEEIEALLTNKTPDTINHGLANQHQFLANTVPNFSGFMHPQGYMPPPGQYPLQGPPPYMGMPNPNGLYMPPTMSYSNIPRSETIQQVQAPGFAPNTATASYSASDTRNDPAFSVPSSGLTKKLSMVEQEASRANPLKKTDHANYSEFPMLGAERFSTKKLTKLSSQRPEVNPTEDVYHESRGMDPESEVSEPHSRRQEKISRIMRYSGVMNPKDKDFVTRLQLSQIVTDDPYNEDFYAQVFRVIHPRSIPGSLVSSIGHTEPNSIAQAYLDQSGHRLGGRFKRADVALQRMQQQVQKAVNVAKERQSLQQNEREGVLGKISVGSGKKPRQQLTILSKAAQKAKDNASIPIEQGECSSFLKPVKKYTKKDIMAILEDIINNLIMIEADSRTASNIDTSRLWNSLHVLENSSLSGDEEFSVNPFIQCLNFEKALKILPRLFKFLNREQSLTIVTLIMSNLENLTVIKLGSYTTYDERQIPEAISKLVDIYSLTFCKVLMNCVQEFRFHEIIGLLVILIQHNAVSFVSTTKIGLSVLTTLLSRAELIRGEGIISATDLSEWTSCYDELFTALESRIAAIFPPAHDDSQNDYVWQFLATLSLGGKLNHQRIIVDEVRDEIFGVMSRAKSIPNTDMARLHVKQNMLNNLNMYLVVMGLVANENEILELQS